MSSETLLEMFFYLFYFFKSMTWLCKVSSHRSQIDWKMNCLHPF